MASFDLIGGAEGIRTPGLVNASHALCQLSYSPTLVNSNGTRRTFRLSTRLTSSASVRGIRLPSDAVVLAFLFCYVVKLLSGLET